MFEAKNAPSPIDETDADLRELIRLGIIEPAVAEDGRLGYRFAVALFSPDYTPNEALLARMVSRRQRRGLSGLRWIHTASTVCDRREKAV